MEIENGNRRVRVFDLRRAVGDVLRDQMPRRQAALGLDDDIGDVVLPRDGHAAEIRLVANLEKDVVEAIQLGDELARERLMNGKQAAMLVERVDRGARDRADAIDVVRGVHRAELPLHLLVHRAEQAQLDHHPLLRRLPNKFLQAREVGIVPAREVEFVPAIGVPGLVAARPRADEPAAGRGQRVARDC